MHKGCVEYAACKAITNYSGTNAAHCLLLGLGCDPAKQQDRTQRSE